MKIAVVSNSLKPQLLNIFIQSFKAKNTQYEYDFYVNEINHHNFRNTANIIKDTFTNIFDYLSQLDSILQMDYDFVIVTENDCFCLRSIEDLLDNLKRIDGWQIFGNTQFNAKVHTDTKFITTEEPDDTYINLDFAILNPRECFHEMRPFAENLIEEEIDYFDRMVINIVNYRKIICPDMVCYSLYQNQKDYSNCYIVRFDDLEEHDKYSPTVKFLPQYRSFIVNNYLPLSSELMENIDYKISLNADNKIESDYLLWYYNLVIGRENCQVTVTKN